MPSLERFKTKYPGVSYVEGISSATGKSERIYYIRYRRHGHLIEEKAGCQYKDDMTPASTANLRAEKIKGHLPTNVEKREAIEAKEKAEYDKWTIDRLWKAYKKNNPLLKGMVTDQNRFALHIKPDFGKKEPKDILPLDVDRLRLKLLKIKSPGTVKNVLELLRRIINFGVKKNLCEGLRFTIEMPRLNNLKTEDLTPEQLAEFKRASALFSRLSSAKGKKTFNR